MRCLKSSSYSCTKYTQEWRWLTIQQSQVLINIYCFFFFGDIKRLTQCGRSSASDSEQRREYNTMVFESQSKIGTYSRWSNCNADRELHDDEVEGGGKEWNSLVRTDTICTKKFHLFVHTCIEAESESIWTTWFRQSHRFVSISVISCCAMNIQDKSTLGLQHYAAPSSLLRLSDEFTVRRR